MSNADAPSHWVRGALLDVKRYTNGGYRIVLLGEVYDPAEPIPCMEFDNSFDCQNWVSRWYVRERGLMQ